MDAEPFSQKEHIPPKSWVAHPLVFTTACGDHKSYSTNLQKTGTILLYNTIHASRESGDTQPKEGACVRKAYLRTKSCSYKGGAQQFSYKRQSSIRIRRHYHCQDSIWRMWRPPHYFSIVGEEEVLSCAVIEVEEASLSQEKFFEATTVYG